MASVTNETTYPESLTGGIHALLEKKAEKLVVLDVRGISSITDFLVIANGTSSPHLRALRIELEKELDSRGVAIAAEGNQEDSGWLVVDAFDVMFHVFHPELREYFRLESLWRDARRIPLADLGFTEEA
jgi:ribosome-associated protein